MDNGPEVPVCDHCGGAAYLCAQPDRSCRLKAMALDHYATQHFAGPLDIAIMALAKLLRTVEDAAWERLSVARTRRLDELSAERDRLQAVNLSAIELLLAAEWSATWVGDAPPCCPWCAGAKPGSIGILEHEQHGVGHRPDCRFEALLRQAGLR